MRHGADHITAADADVRLATYGTLAPGRPNHHQLAGLRGMWAPGTVRGRLHDAGWGAGMGFPALVLDPRGPAVAVQVFTSSDLPDHWDRLDAFPRSTRPVRPRGLTRR